MTVWTRIGVGLCMGAISCTDIGVIGQKAPVRAVEPNAGAAGSAQPMTNAQCWFGLCNVPPLCTTSEPYCLLCDNDSDCVRDPAKRLCSALTSTCVACLSEADCGPDAPYCHSGDCVVCTDDEHCPSDFKCHNHRCEPD